MPYALDEVPVSDDILDPRRVLAWARRKPRDEEYDFCEPRQCAIAQYLIENGVPVNKIGAFEWLDEMGELRHIPILLTKSANHDELMSTFGAFADRLEAALK